MRPKYRKPLTVSLALFGKTSIYAKPRDELNGSSFRQFHRTLELWRVLLDSEIVPVKPGDALHIVARERGCFRSLGEFEQLLFVVDVWQRRRDAIVGQQPSQRSLAECAISAFQETELV